MPPVKYSKNIIDSKCRAISRTIRQWSGRILRVLARIPLLAQRVLIVTERDECSRRGRLVRELWSRDADDFEVARELLSAGSDCVRVSRAWTERPWRHIADGEEFFAGFFGFVALWRFHLWLPSALMMTVRLTPD